ncbi:CobW family GTP-binding protein [Anaerocolumna jejuensis]|uniref:CobW family GTP-binding protein n=1 Tax=Anaerocolumna jejuensis TaxID=259063 RepID=UPI003F7BA57C
MSVKIDIFSGFLGAGKTTLIKKLLEEAFTGEKIALIENEFGTVGIDGRIMKDYDLQITELNAGCICCSIAGDFTQGLREVLKLYKPDRVLIEPSGVSKLSDVIKGCTPFLREGLVSLNLCITVIDAGKYKIYLKNFAEFYKDQLKNAKTIILSRTAGMDREKLDAIIEGIRQYNSEAAIITTSWDSLDGKAILHTAEEECRSSMEELIKREKPAFRISNQKVSGIRIGSQKEGHSAEEVFSVWGIETAKLFGRGKLEDILYKLDNSDMQILRGKGILESENHQWLQFDYVPGEITVREWVPDYTGRICIIGSLLDKNKLKQLFEI